VAICLQESLFSDCVAVLPHRTVRCEAAIRNAEQALPLYLEALAAHGDPIPDDRKIDEPVSLAIVVSTPVIEAPPE
jgi:hypothetical protein